MVLYVVLVRALTGLGQVCRMVGKYEYTHVAVSFEEELTDFVTFSRRKHFAPFDAGFMHEKVEHYAFGRHERVKVKVFCIPVTETAMKRIQAYVQKVEEDGGYIFNLYAMITMPLLHGFFIPKAHNCMSFVGKLLELSGQVELSRPYYQYSIPQMDALLTPYLAGERYLYKKKEDETYMERVSVLYNIKTFCALNRTLLLRMWPRG